MSALIFSSLLLPACRLMGFTNKPVELVNTEILHVVFQETKFALIILVK